MFRLVLIIIYTGPPQKSAIQGVQVKYDEMYKGTLRNILRRTTKKCAVFVGPGLNLCDFHASRVIYPTLTFV